MLCAISKHNSPSPRHSVCRLEEHETMLRIGFGSRVLFLHVKLKVCDPKAPRDCSSPLLGPPLCTFLTRAFSVESARLTCWCSAVRRRLQESSFGALWPSCSDSAPSSPPSAGCQSSCITSSTRAHSAAAAGAATRRAAAAASADGRLCRGGWLGGWPRRLGELGREVAGRGRLWQRRALARRHRSI